MNAGGKPLFQGKGRLFPDSFQRANAGAPSGIVCLREAMRNMRLLVIGGDVRNLYLARLALSRGHDAALIGHGENDIAPVGEYDAAALPYPAAEKEGGAPCAHGNLPMEAAMARAAGGARVYAAKAGPALEAILRQKGCVRIDPSRDEAFVQENAAITAECALWAMAARTRACLCGAECLVLGYGRIGRALALRLRALGARVTVLARSAAALAAAKGDGMDFSPLGGEIPAKRHRLVFNTIPAPAVGEALLSRLAPDAYAMELASAPYGIDLEAARRLHVTAWRESGLPGRAAPESAAAAMLSLIERTQRTDGA